MKCPICAKLELVHDTRDIPYIYKGKSTIFPDVTGDFCPACGEVILDMNEAARTSALMREFSRQVNTSIVDPGFIGRSQDNQSLFILNVTTKSL